MNAAYAFTLRSTGPGWEGELPAGVQRIDAPTRWIELQPRVHVKGEADLAAAEEVLNAITVKGLSEYTGKAAPGPAAYDYPVAKINPKIASSMMVFDDPVQFWEVFSAVMNENPPPESEIKAVLPQLWVLGIELRTTRPHRSTLNELFRPINRLVQFLDRMSILRPSQGQRLFGELPELANGMNQISQPVLAIPESLANAVLHNPPF